MDFLGVRRQPRAANTYSPVTLERDNMQRIINNYGIPDNDGFTTAPTNPPADLDYPVWVGEWVSDPDRYAEWQYRKSIPQSVTRAQAKLALLQAGLLSSVQPAIDSIPDATARTAAQIDWDDRLTFERSNGSLVTMAAMMGMTDAQIDDLFTAASQL